MIRTARTRTFKRTVEVDIPSATEADKSSKESFVASFRAFSRKDLEAIQKAEMTDRQFIEHILVGVDGIGDEEGNPYPVDEQRSIVVEDINFSAAAIAAFNKQYAPAKEKN